MARLKLRQRNFGQWRPNREATAAVGHHALCVGDKADAEQCQEALEKGLFGPLGRLAFFDFQIPQQPLKALAVGIVFLPTREVADVALTA